MLESIAFQVYEKLILQLKKRTRIDQNQLSARSLLLPRMVNKALSLCSCSVQARHVGIFSFHIQKAVCRDRIQASSAHYRPYSRQQCLRVSPAALFSKSMAENRF